LQKMQWKERQEHVVYVPLSKALCLILCLNCLLEMTLKNVLLRKKQCWIKMYIQNYCTQMAPLKKAKKASQKKVLNLDSNKCTRTDTNMFLFDERKIVGISLFLFIHN